MNAPAVDEIGRLRDGATLVSLLSPALNPDLVDALPEEYTRTVPDLAPGQYVMLAVSENESRQLTEVDEALLRIEDEEYGNCLNCEKPINPKRLQAIPWARYCLDCQELLEQGLLDEE